MPSLEPAEPPTATTEPEPCAEAEPTAPSPKKKPWVRLVVLVVVLVALYCSRPH